MPAPHEPRLVIKTERGQIEHPANASTICAVIARLAPLVDPSSTWRFQP